MQGFRHRFSIVMSMLLGLTYLAISPVANALSSSHQVYQKNGSYYLKAEPTYVPIFSSITIIIPTYKEGDIIALNNVNDYWEVETIDFTEFQSVSPTLVTDAYIGYNDVNNDGITDIQLSLGADSDYTFLALYGDQSNSGLFTLESATTPSPDSPMLPILATVPTLENAEASVGSLTGETGVTNGGEARWNTDLVLPAGIGGFAPNVSISYGSQRGNDIMGVGWSLGAFESISRCRRFFEEDGEFRPVEFTDDDRLCLNGERLKLVSGENLKDGAEYRLSMDATVKVTYSKSMTDHYFTLYLPNGESKRFGNTVDSVSAKDSVVYTWRLSERSDSFNNTINYKYFSDSGYQPRLTEISYSDNRVVFHYKDRSDTVKHFYRGESVIKDQLLDWIEIINHQGVAINSYHLEYEASRMSGRMLVTSVTRCDGFATGVCLSPTEFEYSDNVEIGFTEPEKIPLEDLITVEDDYAGCHSVVEGANRRSRFHTYCTTKYVRLADTDGDGKKELLVVNGVGDNYYYKVIEINDDGYTEVSSGNDTLFTHSDSVSTTSFINWESVYPVVVDTDGDGNDELMFVEEPPAGVWADLDGDGKAQFSGRVVRSLCRSCADDDEEILYYYEYAITDTRDINGDGLIDTILRRQLFDRDLTEEPANLQYAGETLYFARINTTAGPGAQLSSSSFEIESPYPTTWYGSTTHMPEDHIAGSADINGDGYSDHERHGCLDGISFKQCTEFGSFGRWTVDVNGDGIADPVEINANGELSYTLNSWDVSRTTTSKGRDPIHTEQILHADFDGDGQPELVVFDFNTQEILIYRDANTSNIKGDMLVKVNDGQGVQTAFTHEALFKFDRYTPYQNSDSLNWNTSPIYDAKGFLQVVSEYTQTSAFNLSQPSLNMTTKMHYEGLRQQAGGRGSLGFAQTIRENATTGTRKITSYRQQYPFTGQISSVEEQFKNSIGNFETTSLFEVLDWENTTFHLGKIKFVTPKTTRTSLFDYTQDANGDIDTIAPIATSVTTESNDWGNHLDMYPLLTSTTVSIVDLIDVGQTSVVHTVNTYLDEDVDKWHISRPTQVAITSTRTQLDESSDTRTNVAKTSYDGTHGRIDYTEIGNIADSDKYLKTDYSYDSFGNTIKVVQCSSHFAVNCGTMAVPTNITANPLHVYRKTESVFDVNGRYLTEQKNALFTEQKILSRDSLGNPSSVENAEGVKVEIYYDSFGREYFRRSETGDFVRTERGLLNDLISIEVTSPSKPTSIEYIDGLGRTLRSSQSTIEEEVSHLDNSYNEEGQLVSTSTRYIDETMPSGYTVFEYNNAGDLWRTTSPDGTTTTLTGSLSSRTKTVSSMNISSTNNPISTVNISQVTRIDTNGLGEMQSTVDGDSNITSYYYDALGLLTKAVNVDQSEVIVLNDEYGRKISMDDPDKGFITFGYNALGELTSRNAPGEASELTFYDALGRAVRIVSSENGQTAFTANYNYVGPRLISESSSEGITSSYGYDTYGRVSSKTSTIDGRAYTESTTYDEFGRVFQVFDASGNYRGIQFAYKNGYQSQIKEASSPTRIYYAVSEMDARFNITKWLFGNGVTGTATFDSSNGFITSIEHSDGQTTSHHQLFEFDSLGNLRARQDLLASKDEIFDYDSLNRLLTGSLNNNPDISLTYTANGNIESKSDVANGGLYRYGENHGQCSVTPGPHALTSVGSKHKYCYDTRGNQLKSYEHGFLTREVTYTSYDKPSKIWSVHGESDFYYGADQKRFKRVDRVNNSARTTHYVGNVEVVTENNSINYKRYIGDQVLVEIDQTNTVIESYFYLDHIGSIVVIADEFGSVKEKLSYDAFGRRREENSFVRIGTLILDPEILSAISITQHGFTGHEHVDHAEVIHMGGRIYDPDVGRFMQADPIVQAPDNGQSLNRYSYVFNNPLSFTDPTGYISEPASCTRDSRAIDGCSNPDIDESNAEENAQDTNNRTENENSSTDNEQTSDGAFNNFVNELNKNYWLTTNEENKVFATKILALKIKALEVQSSGVHVRIKTKQLQGLNKLKNKLVGDFLQKNDRFGLVTSTPLFNVLTLGLSAQAIKASLKELTKASLDDVSNRGVQLAINRATGKAAEAQAAKDLVAEGNSILGSQVSVRTSEGRRVIDHLVQDANGTIRAIEVKAGGGVRNASQLAKDNALATQGGTLVGKNAPAALRGQNMVIETIERRY